jgi:hypothetical protein
MVLPQQQVRELLTTHGLSDLYDPSNVDESEVFRRLDYLGIVLTDAARKGWLKELPPAVHCLEDINAFQAVVGQHGGLPTASHSLPSAQSAVSAGAGAPSLPIPLSQLMTGPWPAHVCTFPGLRARERKPSASVEQPFVVGDLFK